VDIGVRSGNSASCPQNCVYKQNICDKNFSEVQKFNIIIDEKVKCKSMGQRNSARKQAEALMSNDTINVEHTLVKDYSQIPRNKYLKIYHQYIRYLGNQLMNYTVTYIMTPPHILCLLEHHLNESELQLIHLTNYLLGANCCRKTFLKGDVSIFVYRNLKYKAINIYEYNINKDIEACAIQLESAFNELYILAIYRSPRWGFYKFP